VRLFGRPKDDPAPGRHKGARVQWTYRRGEWEDGTVVGVAGTHDVRVRWDDKHPDDKDGWHVLGEDVAWVEGT
jgi:hypothetical protein